jgi:hypothetical protein
MRLLVALVVLLMSCGVGQASPDLRDARYGEVLVVKGRPGHLTATVYSTIGLNDCPQAAWSKLDAKTLKKELGAWSVVLNGPRHFLMDHIVTHRQPGPVTSMEGLPMRAMATLDVPASTILGGLRSKPYEDRVVNRDTEWSYDKGARIYELLSPHGQVYVMQSYALIVDPTLTMASLDGLDKRLHLPKGWAYRARTLASDLRVTTVKGKAHVVQDELQNTYQLLSH